eukprot:TRINITY_DN739_c0_g1_i2.p1 TRINITY_DN739_c0_g1~~TRINITY_DN739_c0_g1_i2.p1  ORF type:complete len:345 (+),score=103.64 TRINITY_DN739_c0_g1_i2:424-1458(+)
MDMNMYESIKGRRSHLSEAKVKYYIYELLKALDHMHCLGIFHRDIKPENVLLLDNVVKLADFGSCRGIYSKQPFTEYISTRWYRPPECLLTDGYYNYKMDIWGTGCIFFEMLNLFPLFPGKNEKDQIHKIHNILGTPSREILERFQRCTRKLNYSFSHVPGTGLAPLLSRATPGCLDIICRMLTYNPDERITAKQALNSPYFKDQRAQEQKTTLFREPGGSSSVSAEDRTNEGSDHFNPPHRNKQQGAKKMNDHGSDGSNSNNEYEEPINNKKLPPIKKKAHHNESEFKPILKQTYSNNFQGGRKQWGGMGQQPQMFSGGITVFKKNYISPYSQKAIFQQKGAN